MTMHKLYLDPFMDMCNGEILSFGIDKHPSAENVLVALEKAIKITSDCHIENVSFRSRMGLSNESLFTTIKKRRIFQVCRKKGIAMIIRSWKFLLDYSSKKSTMNCVVCIVLKGEI